MTGPSKRQIKQYEDRESKEQAMPRLDAIIERLKERLPAHTRLNFSITVSWMEPADPGPTSVTWSNKSKR